MAGPREPCAGNRVPFTWRLERSGQGKLLIGGLGIDPISADEQQLRFATRLGGPPGDWNVP